MKKSTFFLLSLAASSFLVSCSDDKKAEDPKPKSKLELLMAKNWFVTAETETVGSTTKDVFAENYDNCQQDDGIKFLAGNVLNVDKGEVKCNPSEVRTISGTWALSENDTKLVYTLPSFENQTKVDELTANTLVLTYTKASGSQNKTVKTTLTGR